MIRKRQHVLATAALLAAAPTLQAADTTEPVVVTATRTPVTADDTLASVDVITREDIERRQPLDVPDLLSGLPGVDLARNGGRGATSSLFLRGTNSDHTLVLVDGIRVGSATTGGPSLESLATEQIERIEIVRGPRAALYGSEAIGGVIQIFTRRSDGARASVGAGTNNTRELSAGYGASGEQGYWSLNASRSRTDGFDATTEANSNNDPDDDGYAQNTVSLRGERELTEALTLDAAFQRRESEAEYDGFSADEADRAQQHFRVGADWQPADVWAVSLSAGQSLDDDDNRETGGDRFTTRRRSVTLQNDFYPSPDQIVTVGVDYRRDTVDGSIDYAEDSRRNVGVFLQQQWFLGDWNLQIGARHDDNEAFGETTTGSAAAGYRFTPEVRAFASFGTAFKAPSFNDLYYPDTGFFQGNPDLEPERSRSWEIGLAGSGDWDWRLAAFHTEIDQLIVYELATGTNQNVDEAVIRGIEASIGTTLAGFDTNVNAAWIDPRDEATDNRLRRRAKVSAGLDLRRRIGEVALGAGVQYTGDRYDDAANTERLGGYTLVNLDAAWHFTPQWVLRATLRNATDRDYRTAEGYNMPGRTALVTLSWNQDGQ